MRELRGIAAVHRRCVWWLSGQCHGGPTCTCRPDAGPVVDGQPVAADGPSTSGAEPPSAGDQVELTAETADPRAVSLCESRNHHACQPPDIRGLRTAESR